MYLSVSVRSLIVSSTLVMLPLQTVSAFSNNQWRPANLAPAQLAARGIVAPKAGMTDGRFRPIQGEPAKLRLPARAVAPTHSAAPSSFVPVAPAPVQQAWAMPQPMSFQPMQMVPMPAPIMRPLPAPMAMPMPAPQQLAPMQLRPVQPQARMMPQPPAFARQFAWRPNNAVGNQQQPALVNSPQPAKTLVQTERRWRPINSATPLAPQMGDFRPALSVQPKPVNITAMQPQPQPMMPAMPQPPQAPTIAELPRAPLVPQMPQMIQPMQPMQPQQMVPQMPAFPQPFMPAIPVPAQPQWMMGMPYPMAPQPMVPQAFPQAMMPAPMPYPNMLMPAWPQMGVPGQALNWQPYPTAPQAAPVAETGYIAGSLGSF